MRKILVFIIFFYSSQQIIYSQNAQEEGVVSFNIPARNSLKFNKYLINPAFSFVREQNSYLTFYNKRQWIQFDDAPQTYLFNYSGRFRENEGIAIGLFQQNYGVLTTFGAIANYAHNIYLDQDSNLTFGMNVSFYKSGLNNSKIVSNDTNLSLNNIPSNSLITVNPGINYGISSFDFGVSLNNLVLYNLKTARMVNDDPEKSIAVHAMYTGFVDSYGFFDKSKFSALVRTESKKNKTIVSGLMMFSVPKGIWAQAGYNTFYGLSAGIGLNITPKISIEYSYEKEIGDLTKLGSSHTIVFAYKFKSNTDNNDEEEGAIISPSDQRNIVTLAPRTVVKTDRVAIAAEKTKQVIDASTKLDLDTAKKKADADAQAKLVLEAKLKSNVEAAKLAIKKKSDADAQAKLVLDAKFKSEAETAKLAIKKKAEADAQAKLASDAKFKSDNEKAKLAAKTKADADVKAKLVLNAKLKSDAEAAKLADKTKADVQAKLVLEAKLKSEADAAKKKADADAQAKLVLEAKLKSEADAKMKADVDAKAKLVLEAKLKSDSDAAKMKADADAQAKFVLEAKLKSDSDVAQAKLVLEAKLKSEADAKMKADIDAKAKLALDTEAIKLAEDAKLKAAADLAKANAVLKDENAKSMDKLVQMLDDSKNRQQYLLTQLNEKVSVKEKELKDLKEENDLSDRGIVGAPKEFKSVSTENATLESLKSEIMELAKSQNDLLNKFNNLYNERIKKVPNKNDTLTQSYLTTIESLKDTQLKEEQTKQNLISSLEKIKEGTEIEKKRRIKRANFENEDIRYQKDQETLKHIKATTAITETKLKPEDFDYGDDQSNMKILKNIKNVDAGYYAILAVHSDVAKRDVFLTKVVSAGESNLNFFYNINSSEYFIYYNKFDNIQDAIKVLETKGDKPYNGKLIIVKVEKN